MMNNNDTLGKCLCPATFTVIHLNTILFNLFSSKATELDRLMNLLSENEKSMAQLRTYQNLGREALPREASKMCRDPHLSLKNMSRGTLLLIDPIQIFFFLLNSYESKQ